MEHGCAVGAKLEWFSEELGDVLGFAMLLSPVSLSLPQIRNGSKESRWVSVVSELTSLKWHIATGGRSPAGELLASVRTAVNVARFPSGEDGER